METVDTALGKYPKDKCRFIDGTYHLIGNINIENSGEVYLINNRFVRFLTGKIVFNHSVKQYQLRNSSLIEGVVAFNGTEAVKGFFQLSESNLITVITLLTGEKLYVMDENIIPLSYREILSKGEYAHISKLKARDFIRLKAVDQKYKESLNYDSKGITDKYTKLFESNYKPVISSDIKNYAKTIGKLSFGLEFETTQGMIPEHKLRSLPLIPLRDGSIAGLEYVTIPLSGEVGIQAIIDSVKELSKRTEYDDSCALHLHIGNVPRTPEFITAFYKLTAHYQDEMFSMFPLYKKYNFGVKRKNYSKPFPVNLISPQIQPVIDIKNSKSVIDGFSPIFDYLAESARFTDYGNDLNNVGSHPRDPAGHSKWNINTRYYAVNFIPLIFGNHQTIEFRIHTPTYDVVKILDFLFMCSYLINYTIKNTAQILSTPTLFNNQSLFSLINSHILNDVSVDSNTKRIISSEMDNYISSRIGHTYRHNCDGNIKGNEELIKFNTALNLTGKLNLDSNYLPKSEFSSFGSIKSKPILGDSIAKSTSTSSFHVNAMPKFNSSDFRLKYGANDVSSNNFKQPSITDKRRVLSQKRREGRLISVTKNDDMVILENLTSSSEIVIPKEVEVDGLLSEIRQPALSGMNPYSGGLGYMSNIDSTDSFLKDIKQRHALMYNEMVDKLSDKNEF